MEHIAVVDVGSSSMRGILYDGAASPVFSRQYPHRPDFLTPELVEQDPLTWKGNLIAVLKELAEYAKEHSIKITAISMTAQRSSLIPVDREGNALRHAVMWQDKRTVPICEELAELDREVFSLAGAKINPVFTATKITWLHRNEPDIFRKAWKTLVVPDYLNHVMTGEFATDETYGSRSLLMDIRTRKWDKRLLEIFEADEEKMCRLVPPGSILGKITPEFSALTGIPSGTPVVTAGGDQQCAALGLGVIEQGSMEITAGTGAYLIASSDSVPEGLVDNVICGASAVPGKFNLESSILTCCSVFDWYVRNFYGKCDGNPFREVDADIAATPAGCHGVRCLPYFQGRGTPDWNSRSKGLFANVTLNSSRADFARSTLEGVACEAANNLEVLEGYVGRADRISISGGLTKNPVFNQILADACCRELSKYKNVESTALGAWISGAVAVGLYPSFRAAADRARLGDEQQQYAPGEEGCGVYRQVRKELEHFYQGTYGK